MTKRQKKIKELREKIREYERPINRLSGFVILDLFSGILDLLEDERVIHHLQYSKKIPKTNKPKE